MEDEINTALQKLSLEARELYLSPSIPILDFPPSPLIFLREYVSKNRPVIIKNALTNWPALTKWTDEYLEVALGSTKVTVTVTPDGYADAPVGENFVLPEERLMSFGDFLKIWNEKNGNIKANGIYYVQKQNSNFMDEFDLLIADADSHVSWATEAFGTKPDAVNFWMGNSNSVTSMHKDHYENLYAVIRGQKTFILHPPTDIHFIPYKTYQLARYQENQNGTFEIISGDKDKPERSDNALISENIIIDGGQVKESCSKSCEDEEMKEEKEPKGQEVSWIAVDPLNPDLKTYPQYSKCKKYVADVGAGDLLYLPSLWFHHVTQSDRTIAVNFWYDMEYDIKYNYFKYAEEVSNILCKYNTKK